MNILLVGANGRMGSMVCKCKKEGINIVAGIDKNSDNSSVKIYKNFRDLKDFDVIEIDVVLDFAMPGVLREELAFCLKYKKPLVICSTGHDSVMLDLINSACRVIPIFKTTNTSMGIALINKIIKDNIDTLLKYDIKVIEKHHKNKKDCPSGTANTIIENFNKYKKDIECFSVRAGSVVGEHELLLYDNSEVISIKHIAESRELFARGALNICEFMRDKQTEKLYTMEDMLNSI